MPANVLSLYLWHIEQIPLPPPHSVTFKACPTVFYQGSNLGPQKRLSVAGLCLLDPLSGVTQGDCSHVRVPPWNYRKAAIMSWC